MGDLKLPEDAVHIWNFNIDDFSKDIEFYANFLSKEEIEKSNKFKFENDKHQSVFSRSFLRILLGKYLNENPKDLNFKYSKYGKPSMKDGGSLKFNVSHSGDMITLGFVNDYKIGVDVEKEKGDFKVLEVAQNFFSPDEINALETFPKAERVAAFYRCWTRKESFIKAEGSGLSFPLASFTVSLDNDAQLLKTEWNALEKDKWNLFSFKREVGYIGAIAVKGAIKEVRYFNWDGDNFPLLP